MKPWLARLIFTAAWIGCAIAAAHVPETSPDYIVFRVGIGVFVTGSILVSIADQEGEG